MNIVAAPAPPLIVDLSRSYTARTGAPCISQVAVDIFQLRYFTHCMSCGFCGVYPAWVARLGTEHVRSMLRHAPVAPHRSIR